MAQELAKKRSQLFYDLLYWAVMVCCLLFLPAVWANEFHVLIIKSGDSSLYNTVEEGVISKIREAESQNVEFTSISSKSTETSTTAEHKPDIIISIGLAATQAAISIPGETPILSTLIPQQAFDTLTNQNAGLKAKGRIGAVYLDPLPERVIALTKIIFGKKKSIAILTSLPNTDYITRLKELCSRQQLKLSITEATEEGNLVKTLSTILLTNDVLLATPDPIIFNRNTAKSILLTSYRHRVPVIGYSESYVKAGALASIFSSPEQIAAHTGEEAIKILSGKTPQKTFPKYFSVSFNHNVARSLGISLPDDNETQKLIEKTTGQKR